MADLGVDDESSLRASTCLTRCNAGRRPLESKNATNLAYRLSRVLSSRI